VLRVLGQRAPEVAARQVLGHQHDLARVGARAQKLRARAARRSRAGRGATDRRADNKLMARLGVRVGARARSRAKRGRAALRVRARARALCRLRRGASGSNRAQGSWRPHASTSATPRGARAGCSGPRRPISWRSMTPGAAAPHAQQRGRGQGGGSTGSSERGGAGGGGAARACTMLVCRSDFRMPTSLRKRACSLGECPRTNFTATGVLPCSMPLYTCAADAWSGPARQPARGARACLRSPATARTDFQPGFVWATRATHARRARKECAAARLPVADARVWPQLSH
jgi:hypothetical protein